MQLPKSTRTTRLATAGTRSPEPTPDAGSAGGPSDGARSRRVDSPVASVRRSVSGALGPRASLAGPPATTPARAGMQAWARLTGEQAEIMMAEGQVLTEEIVTRLAYLQYLEHGFRDGVLVPLVSVQGSREERETFNDHAIASQDRRTAERKVHWSSGYSNVASDATMSRPGRLLGLSKKRLNLHSSRLTVTVDPFVQPEGAPAASTSKKRRDAYDDLTGVVAEWVSDGARSGRAGKVFSPATLFEGRIDHAVAYSPILLPRPGETAGAVSSRLGDPATVHLLGMEPVAPGVAYGENRKRLFKPNPSFGMERSRVITRAVMAAIEAGEPGPLADRVLRHLDEAIDHKGYSLSNPARISPSTGRKAFESMKRILLNRRRDEGPPAAQAPMATTEPTQPPEPAAPADQALPGQAGG